MTEIRGVYVDKCRLKLYVSGHTPRSDTAIVNILRICKENLMGNCELDVVDALAQPRLHEGKGVLATPTLVKEGPGPVRRIVGSMSNAESVLAALGLESYADSK